MAIRQLRMTLELDATFLPAKLFLGETFEEAGMFEEAVAEFQEATRLSGRHPVYLSGLGHAYAVSGQKKDARMVIDELIESSKQTYVPARGIAEIYAGLGEKDMTFSWLDKALEQRNGWLFHIKANPRYDCIRSDPRYADVVRRIGLPP